jgi:hypothetical protein
MSTDISEKREASVKKKKTGELWSTRSRGQTGRALVTD